MQVNSVDGKTAVEIIKNKLTEASGSARIPMQRGSFQATLLNDGIEVTNLSTQPFLAWKVFEEAIWLLQKNGGSAMRGDAMSARLGDPKLPFNSVEGHIANVVYKKQKGDTVFRRISPIAAILVWAGLCEPRRGILLLRKLRL